MSHTNANHLHHHHHMGFSFDTLQRMIDAFNSDCLPYVPEQGTVGASGDLAPLAHLALGTKFSREIKI